MGPFGWTAFPTYTLPCVVPGILEVLHCVLVESPEALNIIKEGHIKSIISLLDKHGRNYKVLLQRDIGSDDFILFKEMNIDCNGFPYMNWREDSLLVKLLYFLSLGE